MFGKNTFDPAKDIPSLDGKVYIVTGGTAGIGFGIVSHILQHNPSKIYLISAKEEHAAEAQKELMNWGDVTKVEWRQCDLTSLKQTNAVAKELAQELTQLDGLVCNAGVGIGNYALTDDDLDWHMQVNLFSQAHLALTLLPLLQKTTNSRLVFQSSEVHRFALSDTKFASIDEINTDIGATKLYARTKLAQILFMHALVPRIKAGHFGPISADRGEPWINCSHPGAVNTDQPDQMIPAYGKLGKVGVKFMRPLLKDPEDKACRPALFAATGEDIVEDTIQNSYITPDRKVSDVSKQGHDETLAENLWNLTREVLESKLGNLPYKM